MRAARLALVLATMIALPGAGCVFRRGPEDVRRELSHGLGCELERDVALKFGFFTTKAALGVARLASHEPAPLRGLSAIEMGVYSLPQGRKPAPSRTITRVEFAGWEDVVRARDGDDEVRVLMRTRRGRIRGLMVISRDGEEVEVMRLRGDLQELLEAIVRGSLAGAGIESVEASIHIVARPR